LALTPALHADTGKWLVLLAAFACWSAVASAGYPANDRLDLAADRADPAKPDRPLASGAAPARARRVAGTAPALVRRPSPSATPPPPFLVHLAAYPALTLAYSLYVKRLLLLDVLLLAALYALRLLAGGAAVGIELTPWLLAFSLFFFLGLAFAKRYGELHRMTRIGASDRSGRAYRSGDLRLLVGLGATSAYLSALVLCVYSHSEPVGRPAPPAEAL